MPQLEFSSIPENGDDGQNKNCLQLYSERSCEADHGGNRAVLQRQYGKRTEDDIALSPDAAVQQYGGEEQNCEKCEELSVFAWTGQADQHHGCVGENHFKEYGQQLDEIQPVVFGKIGKQSQKI